MRITLTIDDATGKALMDLARKSDRTFEEVVNDALRAGLGAKRAQKAKPYRLQPVSLGGVEPGVNLDKALALADALEDQEIAAKLELRK
jgi:hypothetical protein